MGVTYALRFNLGSAKMKIFNERGDTIVEVMVVLAILSFAVIISYSTANRSLRDAQQSEQNSTATELAQSQVEQIRSMVLSSNNSNTGAISNLTSEENYNQEPFCMNNGTQTPGACTYTAIEAGGTGVSYSVSDTLYQPPPQASFQSGFPDIYLNEFQVQVTWPDALGEGTDTVTLSYRAYPPPVPS
jgi:type II secretory pathway pseudopilin PulG